MQRHVVKKKKQKREMSRFNHHYHRRQCGQKLFFFSHIISIPLFFLQPGRLFREFASISSDSYIHFALNALTQYVCITGVYILNDKTSAFTLILTLTLRKLCTFSLSVAYFGHYRHFTTMEWVAMVTALAAGALYPLLPKAHPPSNLCVTPTEKGSKER
ncbi:hypothetical protein C3747_2g696 [Trypanosoma cruzi]|uniref:UDP-galactose transporter n=1 Tax=Trypanosoma cruzi TaxID=5693 RepID=A0A2V2XKK0_TRYCR|nr:hypothetical protein C3747_2g696 [Trypanosoma cruzi]